MACLNDSFGRPFGTRRMPGLPCRQSGVALITALVVVAIATVAAVSMTWRQQLDLRRTSNVLRSDQAELYALGVEDWARGVLTRDWQRDPKGAKVDGLADEWAKPLPATPVAGGQVSGSIEDLQGRFNLNNLYTPAYGDAPGKLRAQRALAYFRRLLRTLNLDERIAPAVADWIDGDMQTRFPDGAEDDQYMRADLPYRPANGKMASISELRLVKGITEQTYRKLAPYVSALPGPTTINVNTAPAPVLAALADNVDPSRVAAAVEVRKTKPFRTAAAFLQQLGWVAHGASTSTSEGAAQAGGDINPGTLIGVSSRFYLVHANVRVEHARQRWFMLIEEGADGIPQVLARTRGAD